MFFFKQKTLFAVLFFLSAMVLTVLFFRLGETRAEEVTETVINGSSFEKSAQTNIDLSGRIVIEDTPTIPAGVRVTILPGSTVLFDDGSYINTKGTLDIRGTPSLPVEVRSLKDGGRYTIMANDTGTVRARHTNFFRTDSSNVFSFHFGLAVAWADENHATFLSINGGDIDTAHCRFVDGEYAVVVREGDEGETCEDPYEGCEPEPANPPVVRIWASSFEGGERKNQVISYDTSNNADLRYNYWDGVDPVRVQLSDFQYKITGRVMTSSWTTDREMRDPVIIVPGIYGSWRWTPKSPLELDPIFHTYDSLVAQFAQNGYEEGKTLFPFPYEWRRSNAVTEDLLKMKIRDVREQTHWPIVDVVAHSMGGLVARDYIASDDYAGEIDQLVLLGTPNIGSPASYQTWEGGEVGYSPTDKVAKLIFTQEAKNNGYDDIFSYVRTAPIASVRELLPTYAYLHPAGLTEVLRYGESYPRNLFLEDVAGRESAQPYAKVTVSNIVGKLDGDKTITGYSVGLPRHGAEPILWEHGKPEGYDDMFGSHGLLLGAGDGTVPAESSRAFPADEFFTVSASHQKIPDTAREKAYSLIVGVRPKMNTVAMVTSNLMIVQPVSASAGVPKPRVIVRRASDGKSVGKDRSGKVKREIAGAFYTEGDTNNEFITIPNPTSGEYVIAVSNEEGLPQPYKIETTSVKENPDGTAMEVAKEIVGTTDGEGTAEAVVTVDDTGMIDASDAGNGEQKTENGEQKTDNGEQTPLREDATAGQVSENKEEDDDDGGSKEKNHTNSPKRVVQAMSIPRRNILAKAKWIEDTSRENISSSVGSSSRGEVAGATANGSDEERIQEETKTAGIPLAWWLTAVGFALAFALWKTGLFRGVAHGFAQGWRTKGE